MSDEDQLSTFIAGRLDESFCGVGVCRDERRIGSALAQERSAASEYPADLVTPGAVDDHSRASGASVAARSDGGDPS
jgi:hypothetical protein